MAHGLQIMQNCEAFAAHGVDVTLWLPRRAPIPGAEAEGDPWDYYEVERNFAIRWLPTLDLTRYVHGRQGLLARLIFYLGLGTFALSVVIAALFTRADIYYSRDPAVLFILSWIKPRKKLVYEAHRLNQPGMGERLQRAVLRRVGVTVAINPPLRDRLAKRQAGGRHESRLMVAHDGIRRARFETILDQDAARQKAGWPEDRFIVGYVGRLQTLGMAKGVDSVIDALAKLPQAAALGLVGGPDDIAASYRDYWRQQGLSDADFLYAGHVPAGEVPLWLSAFDICVMPFPWTEHYAYYMSPIKLFEYLASGRALIVTDLPSIADVVQDGENAVVIPPSDPDALAAAIEKLRNDSALRERLAANARDWVMAHYTWEARTAAILNFIGTVGA